MYDPPSLPPAGWYPDPERPGAMRWWDGSMWAAPTPVWSTWRTDQLPEIGELLGGGFRIMAARWRALLTVAVMTGLPSALLIVFALHRLGRGVVITEDGVSGWTSDRVPIVVGTGSIAILLSGLGSIAGWWLTLRSVDEERQAVETIPRNTSGEVQAGVTALTAALRILPRVIGWTLVVALAGGIVAALLVVMLVASAALGVLALLALVPVFIYVTVRLAFVGQAMVDRPGNPFRRSWTVSGERFWATFGRILLVGIIAGMIGFGINLVTSTISASDGGGGFGSTFQVSESGEFEDIVVDDIVTPTTGSVIGTTIGALAAVVTTGFTGAAYALMYRTRNPPDE